MNGPGQAKPEGDGHDAERIAAAIAKRKRKAAKRRVTKP
jgi:hypothetical protein